MPEFDGLWKHPKYPTYTIAAKNRLDDRGRLTEEVEEKQYVCSSTFRLLLGIRPFRFTLLHLFRIYFIFFESSSNMKWWALRALR